MRLRSQRFPVVSDFKTFQRLSNSSCYFPLAQSLSNNFDFYVTVGGTLGVFSRHASGVRLHCTSKTTYLH